MSGLDPPREDSGGGGPVRKIIYDIVEGERRRGSLLGLRVVLPTLRRNGLGSGSRAARSGRRTPRRTEHGRIFSKGQ